MRTTLTLDDDVAAMLEQVRGTRGWSLKQVVNDALRLGLGELSAPPTQGPRYTMSSSDLGRCLIGDVEDIAEALAAAEGEDYL